MNAKNRKGQELSLLVSALVPLCSLTVCSIQNNYYYKVMNKSFTAKAVLLS